MTITSVYPNINPYVGNPAVDMVRRENQRRDIIEPVAQMERSAAEKGLSTDDKNRHQNQSAAYVSADDSKTRNTELKQAIHGRPDQQSREQAEQEGSPEQGQSSNQQQSKDQRQLADLKKHDAEVKAHEQAHASMGGDLASAPSFDVEIGPDGQQYAVGGEVNIDMAVVPGDPQATIVKMQKVKAAALAPTEPSSADRRVASEAQRRILEAQAELAQQAIQLNEPPAADASYWLDEQNNPFLSKAAQIKGAESSDQTNVTNSRPSAFAPSEQASLEQAKLMQRRSQVIGDFYRHAVMPAERPLLLTA